MNKLSACILLFFLQLACAQSALVQFPSGPSSWTVTLEQKGSGASDSADEARLRRIEIAQTADTRRSVLHMANGKSRELWSLTKLGMMLTEDPAGNAFTTRNAAAFGDPFGPSNFDWISNETRVGENPVKFEGVDCYYFKGAMQVPIPDPSGKMQFKSVPCEAWIDAKTQLPVGLLKEGVLGKFVFGAPPENLEMPEKFKKTLEYYRMTQGY